MNLHFVSAGFPDGLGRREREIAAVVFQRNVHSILSDYHGGIEAGHRFREAAPEHLELLIMLVQAEHNEDRRSSGMESVGRLNRNDLMCPLSPQFLVEPFRCRNSMEQAFRRGVEVVGGYVLETVLKIGNGGVFSNRQLCGLERRRRRQRDEYDRCDYSLLRSSCHSHHGVLVH